MAQCWLGWFSLIERARVLGKPLDWKGEVQAERWREKGTASRSDEAEYGGSSYVEEHIVPRSGDFG